MDGRCLSRNTCTRPIIHESSISVLLPLWQSISVYIPIGGKQSTARNIPGNKHSFDILWNNHLSPSTPVLGNTGTDRGCTVSCSGTYIGDNVYSFYENLQENAVLTQEGLVRPPISVTFVLAEHQSVVAGRQSSILPVFKAFVQMSSDISQESNRRGAWAGSVPIDHPDWDEGVILSMNTQTM